MSSPTLPKFNTKRRGAGGGKYAGTGNNCRLGGLNARVLESMILLKSLCDSGN